MFDSDGPIALNTDLAEAVAALGRATAPAFALPANRFHVHAAKGADRSSRRGIKRFIRPENARPVIDALPTGPDDRTHCVLRGDFVLGDVIPLILGARGNCPHLRISTLGMSTPNAEMLAFLVASGLVDRLTVVVSLYFRQVDKATTFREVAAALAGCARLVVTRSHAKVILIPTASGDSFVIEGSANLRSSDNLEQMCIVNDPETHAFHASWIDALAD